MKDQELVACCAGAPSGHRAFSGGSPELVYESARAYSDAAAASPLTSPAAVPAAAPAARPLGKTPEYWETSGLALATAERPVRRGPQQVLAERSLFLPEAEAFAAGQAQGFASAVQPAQRDALLPMAGRPGAKQMPGSASVQRGALPSTGAGRCGPGQLRGFASVQPEHAVYSGPQPAQARRVTLRTLRAKHARGDPLTMVTAYDYPSAVHVCSPLCLQVCVNGAMWVHLPPAMQK